MKKIIVFRPQAKRLLEDGLCMTYDPPLHLRTGESGPPYQIYYKLNPLERLVVRFIKYFSRLEQHQEQYKGRH